MFVWIFLIFGCVISDNGFAPSELAVRRLENFVALLSSQQLPFIPEHLLRIKQALAKLEDVVLACATRPSAAQVQPGSREKGLTSRLPRTVAADPERDALLALFANAGGRFWTVSTGWDSDAPICTWYGIFCDVHDHVTTLRLASNGLRGTIPPDLGLLHNLEELNLESNHLIGSIPAALFDNMTNLVFLSLSHNGLQGVLPPKLGKLPQLTFLDLNYNLIGGPLPFELAELTRLTSLDLSSNQFEGLVPAMMGRLSNLRELNLQLNLLKGSIPMEFGNLTNLQSLILSDNQFVGDLPEELGRLSSLTSLQLSNNRLQKLSNVGLLTKLRYLAAAFNSISGEIPTELGNLTGLELLQLQKNNFEGSIPPEIGALSNLTSLDLSNNKLTEIPTEIWNLSSLKTFSLAVNKFNGSIPHELENLVHLERLDLQGNEFEGGVPFLVGLTALQYLNLGSNQLDGQIPFWLGQMTSLTELTLSNNRFQGSVPTSFGLLTKLELLDLGFNLLDGDIPIEVGTLTALSSLLLSHNAFTSLPRLLGPVGLMDVSTNQIQVLGYENNATYIDASFNPIYQILPEFWSSPFLISLRVRHANLSNLTLFAPVRFASSKLQELALAGNNLGDWFFFEESFHSVLSLPSLRTLDLRDCQLIGNIADFFGKPALFDFLDLGDNVGLVRHCSSSELCNQISKWVDVRLDNTSICIDGCSLFDSRATLQYLDISNSDSCFRDDFTQLNALVTLKYYGQTNECFFNTSVIRDNQDMTTYFANKSLTCPQRETLSGIILSDANFLNYRSCYCQSDSRWDWTQETCVVCGEHLACDPNVNSSNHALIGSYYALIDGRPPARAQYPFASIVQCETRSACNPSCQVAPCNLSNFVICGEGRDPNSRLCSRCLEGWYALGLACNVCHPSYPYLVMVLLPLTILGIMWYLWHASAPAKQAGAGLPICIFGLQILSVIKDFFPTNAGFRTSVQLPGFLEVFRQAANFRPWSLECLNPQISFHFYFYVKMFTPLLCICLFLLGSILLKVPQHRLCFMLYYFLQIAYFPLCVASLQPLRCDSNDMYLINIPYLDCPDLELRILGITGFLVYGVGIPGWFGFLLWRHKNDLRSPDSLAFKFLVDSLVDSPHLVFWAMWRIIRKLVLALAVTLMSRHAGFLPLTVTIMLLVSAVLHLHSFSYVNKLDNMLELFVATSCAVLYLISVLQAASDEYNDLGVLRDILDIVIMSVLVIGTVFYIVMRIWNKIKARKNKDSLESPFLAPEQNDDERSISRSQTHD